MTREDIVRYATRDWAGLADAKADYWAARKTTLAPAEIMQLGDDLRRHALAVRPDWPNAADRETDAAAHRRVSEALRAVSFFATR